MPVSARASDVEELLSQLRVRLVVAAPEGRPRCGLGLANASHLGAEVNRLEVDGHAMGLQDARESLGDLAAEPLLNGEAPGEEAHQPSELGDANDVLMGDVAQVGVAEEGEGVVLAERVERNWPVNHLAQLTVGPAVALGRKRGHEFGVALVALGRIEHRAQVSLGRLLGTWRIQRHAYGRQDLADVPLEAAPVLVADAPWTYALPIATLDLFVAQAANAWF